MSILIHILGVIAIRRRDAGSGRRGGGPMNAWLRWVCVAAALATAPAAPTDEHDGFDLPSLLAGAVLDWCDAQGGDFRLPHISAPSCETGEVVYLGTLKGVFGEAADAAWWWKQRTRLARRSHVRRAVVRWAQRSQGALHRIGRTAVSVPPGARRSQQPGAGAGGAGWPRGRCV